MLISRCLIIEVTGTYAIWVDNCGGQNKCWTLYTMMVGLVNSQESMIENVTLKYFTVGHSFMSADNFHSSVEREMKKMDKVYDFNDFIQCVAGRPRVYVS